jgi:hypothetical protein
MMDLARLARATDDINAVLASECEMILSEYKRTGRKGDVVDNLESALWDRSQALEAAREVAEHG